MVISVLVVYDPKFYFAGTFIPKRDAPESPRLMIKRDNRDRNNPFLFLLTQSSTQCYKPFTAVSYGRNLVVNVIKHFYGQKLRQQSHLAA